MMLRILMATTVMLTLGTFTAAAQKFYDPDILSIIGDYGCAGCHGGSGGLTVTPYASLMTTGDHAPVVVANDSNSVLVRKLKGTATFGSRMPLGGPYLSDAEIRTVVQWIMEGARASATTTVADGRVLPGTIELHQNYPNPFNPRTTIRYSVGSGITGSGAAGMDGEGRTGAGWVKLAVYDLLGREVAVLVNEPHAPGIYDASFTADRLPSGLYMAKLTAGTVTQARKMALVR